jgi:hypothetical protein
MLGSLYIFLYYLKNNRFIWYHFVIFGMCVGYSINLRPNSLFIYICISIFYLYDCSFKKNYKFCFQIILFSLLGFLIICLPIIFYYIYIDHLAEYFNWNLFYPSIYLQGWDSSFIKFIIKSLFKLNFLWFFINLTTIGLFLFYKKYNLLTLSILLFIAGFINIYFINMSLRYYDHYYRMQIPFIIGSLIFLIYNLQIIISKEKFNDFIFKLFIVISSIVFLSSIRFDLSKILIYSSYSIINFMIVMTLIFWILSYHKKFFILIPILCFMFAFNSNIKKISFTKDYLYSKGFVLAPNHLKDEQDINNYLLKYHTKEKVAITNIYLLSSFSNKSLSQNGFVVGNYDDFYINNKPQEENFIDMIKNNSVFWIYDKKSQSRVIWDSVYNLDKLNALTYCKMILYENNTYKLCNQTLNMLYY